MSSEVAELEREVGEVPDGWKVQPLSNLCGEVTERVDPAAINGDLGGHYVGLEHIGQGTGQLEDIGEAADVVSQKSRFHAGDILYGKLRPNLQKVARPDFGGVCSTDIIVLRAKQSADPGFLFQVLQSEPLVSHAIATAAGTKMPRTHARSILSFEIAAPPLDEQRRIAEVLRSVDDAIAAAQCIAEQAQVVWHGLAEGLIWERLEQDVSLSRPLGAALNGSDYGVNASLRSEQSGHAILRMGNLQDGYIDPTDLKWAQIEGPEAEALALNVGDILFNRTNSRDLVGKVALVREATDFLYASYIVRLRVNQSVADPYYLYAVMHSRRAQSEFKSIATPGVSQCNVNPTNLKKQVIPLPSLAEQRDIAGQLKSAETLRRNVMDELVTLRQLKSDLMADLLSGHVRMPE
jgi:type I restriction enzyme, S subunit